MYNSVNKYPTKDKWYNYIEYVKGVNPLSKNYYVIKNDGNNLNDLMKQYPGNIGYIREKTWEFIEISILYIVVW